MLKGKGDLDAMFAVGSFASRVLDYQNQRYPNEHSSHIIHDRQAVKRYSYSYQCGSYRSVDEERPYHAPAVGVVHKTKDGKTDVEKLLRVLGLDFVNNENDFATSTEIEELAVFNASCRSLNGSSRSSIRSENYR